MSNTIRAKFDQAVSLMRQDGDNPEALSILTEIASELASEALMDTTIKFYSSGRESEIPAPLRNDALRSLRKRVRVKAKSVHIP